MIAQRIYHVLSVGMRCVVYWSFVALGLAPRVEEISHLGRCDMVVIYQDQVFVMEFKMLSGSNVQKSLEEGFGSD